jgi:hypothetical protein
MAYTSVAPRALAYPESKTSSAPRRGFFARFLDALMAVRLRQAEREIASYLADTGGKFTDESEREIERRFLANSPRW